jgi:hypothetical protein
VRNGELEMKAAAVGSQQQHSGEVFEFGLALVSSVRSMGTGPCLCMHMDMDAVRVTPRTSSTLGPV